MNVLSLFDGMSCGRIALERAGIKVNKYFASEIDKYAIQIAKKNYPDTIHIGDVKDVMYPESFDGHKIDLVIGGSPCQGFSFARKGLNFDDQRSKLFFEYARLIKECKPKYFLLENVRMKQECQNVISEILGVKPIKINSSLLSAQNRQRLYWTNIPVSKITDKGLVLKDILQNDHNMPDRPSVFYATKKPSLCKQVAEADDIRGMRSIKAIYSAEAKSPTLTTMTGGHREPKVATGENTYRKLTPLECERLQTVPDNYTDGVSKTQRYKMLGNGWTVDVIAHIFKNLKGE